MLLLLFILNPFDDVINHSAVNIPLLSATTSVQDSLEREQFQDRSEFGVASAVKQDFDEDNTWIPSLLNEEHTGTQNKMRHPNSDLNQDNKSVQARGEEDERPSAYFNETKKPEVSGTMKVTGRGGGGASGFYLEYGQHERTEGMREGGRRQEMVSIRIRKQRKN